QKVRVKKLGNGDYRVVGKAGRRVKLLPQDVLKHQADPIGAEFDVMVVPQAPTTRLIRKARK
ncbi:hypothetical protein HY488_01830, partial [Candidatus Woesearchaeota archaeon]|nr:hypothetical protein [Candidatus Woesearchaeota archaeon]